MQVLIPLLSLLSLAAAQWQDAGFSYQISYTTSNEASSLSSALSSQSSAWLHSLTKDDNWGALISALPKSQQQALSVIVTADYTGKDYSSAVAALQTLETTTSLASSVVPWFSSAEVNLYCGQESVVTRAGGVITTQTGFSCPSGAASSSRMTMGGGVWGVFGIVAAGVIAGGALLL